MAICRDGRMVQRQWGKREWGRMMEDEEKEGDVRVIIFTNVLTPNTKDCVHVTASSALMLQFATD